MATDRDEIVALLTQLNRAFTPTKWTTPLGLPRHRALLAEWLRTGDGAPYREPFEFPECDPGPVVELLDQLRVAAEGLPAELRPLVDAHVESVSGHLAAVVSRDDALLSAWSEADTGLPTAEVQAEARRILAAPVGPDEPTPLGAEDLRAAVEGALRRHEIVGWRVELDPGMTAMASVNGGLSRIRVRSDVALSEHELHRLVAHEVGGHVLRWENARRQREPLAAFPFANGAADEEGLAALREREHGLESAENLHRYAARVLGVAELHRRDLMSLARFLNEFLDPDAAAELALRLRRGIVDPSSPGGITKDHGYLSGVLRLAAMSADDIRLLRATKWGSRHLDVARQLRAEGAISTTTLMEYQP